MTAAHGRMDCTLYLSAFSGEVVVTVDTADGEVHESVVPNHYTDVSNIQLTQYGMDGQVKVRVLKIRGNEATVSMPDGQLLYVSADKVHKGAD